MISSIILLVRGCFSSLDFVSLVTMKKEDKERLKVLLWDSDINKASLKKSRKTIVERVLKYGRMDDIRWLLRQYSDDEIIDIVRRSSNLDRRTANYWALRYHIPKSEVKCFQKPPQIGYFV